MNLSVIIAIYNGQEYISRCLDSILAQKNITKEIIVVNDGSTDKTSDILNEYKHLKEIIIINQANAGQGVARNNGLKIANGKYITFVDADDFLLFDYTYDKLISRCEKEHLDMIIYRYNTLKNNQIIRTSIIEDDQRLYSSSEIINKFLCTNEVEGFCWNKIIKREIISKNQINSMEEFKKQLEDFKNTSKELNQSLNNFTEGFKTTQEATSKNIAEIIKNELSDIKCEIIKNLDKSLIDVEKSVSELNEKTNIVSEQTKASTDFFEGVNNQLKNNKVLDGIVRREISEKFSNELSNNFNQINIRLIAFIIWKILNMI